MSLTFDLFWHPTKLHTLFSKYIQMLLNAMAAFASYIIMVGANLKFSSTPGKSLSVLDYIQYMYAIVSS